MSSNDDIAKRAYELWEQAGRPQGKDEHYWLQAETELKRQDNQRKLKNVAAQELLKTPKPRKVVGG